MWRSLARHLGIGVVACLVLGCAGPVETGRQSADAGSPSGSASAPAGSGAGEVRQAIAATVAGLDRGLFADVETGPSQTTRQGSWLRITVRVPATTDGGQVLADWEAQMLVAAAAGRLAGERSAETITGYEVSYRLPDGSVVDSGGGPAGSTAEAEERFDDSPAATVADQVRADIADLPASVTQLRVLRPKDAAVVLVLTVTDPDLMIGSVARIMDKIDHHYEGVYVELRNTSGVPLAIGFRAARVPMGGQYFRPECEALTGMAHGGPTSDQQASRPLPPCR